MRAPQNAGPVDNQINEDSCSVFAISATDASTLHNKDDTAICSAGDEDPCGSCIELVQEFQHEPRGEIVLFLSAHESCLKKVADWNITHGQFPVALSHALDIFEAQRDE